MLVCWVVGDCVPHGFEETLVLVSICRSRVARGRNQLDWERLT
jgi:hypothetical protein